MKLKSQNGGESEYKKKKVFPVICGQCSSQDAYLMMCVCVLIRQVVINLGNNLIKLSKGLALAPMTSKRLANLPCWSWLDMSGHGARSEY